MNKIIIIVGGLVVAVVIALVLAWPQYQKIQALNLDIEIKGEDLRSQETYFSQVKDIAVKLQEYSDTLLKTSNALPKDPSLASLVNFLQINSAQTGLILKKIVLGGTVAPSENKGALMETQLIIQVSGSYDAFKDFLKLVENSARIIEVQNISIDIPSEKLGESPMFTLDLKTFSY